MRIAKLQTDKKTSSGFYMVVRWLTSLCTLALFLALLAKYVSPLTFWPLAFFGLAFPILFLLNMLTACFWMLKSNKWLLLPVLAMILSIPNLFGNFQFENKSKPYQNRKDELKVMTFNCMLFDLYNWSHNKDSRNLIFSMLQKSAPDILCLQEFYQSEGKYAFRNADTLLSFLPTKNIHLEYTTTLRETDHWGVATLTKFPIIHKGKITFDTPSNNICIFTDIVTETDTIRIYNLHLASIRFGKPEYSLIDNLSKNHYSETNLQEGRNILTLLKRGFLNRATQIELVRSHIHSCPYKIILCGDFNDTPSSYAYYTLSKGLQDAFRESGNGIGRTYNGSLPFLRIDYVLYSPFFESSHYEQESASITDHFPVSCTLHHRIQE